MKKEAKVVMGVGAAGAIALGLYFATRAKAAPPPGLPYCCPYCSMCFETYEELVAHVKDAHAHERIPLPIEWD